jgi:hypothetical protein
MTFKGSAFCFWAAEILAKRTALSDRNSTILLVWSSTGFESGDLTTDACDRAQNRTLPRHWSINCLEKIGPRLGNEIHSFGMRTHKLDNDQCRPKIGLLKWLLWIMQPGEQNQFRWFVIGDDSWFHYSYPPEMARCFERDQINDWRDLRIDS